MTDDLDELLKEIDRMPESVKKANRVWLNRSKSLHAFAAWDFEYSEDYGDVWASLDVADCNRIISLDLTCRNEKQRKAALAKLDRLSKMIEEVRYELETVPTFKRTK